MTDKEKFYKLCLNLANERVLAIYEADHNGIISIKIIGTMFELIFFNFSTKLIEIYDNADNIVASVDEHDTEDIDELIKCIKESELPDRLLEGIQ